MCPKTKIIKGGKKIQKKVIKGVPKKPSDLETDRNDNGMNEWNDECLTNPNTKTEQKKIKSKRILPSWILKSGQKKHHPLTLKRTTVMLKKITAKRQKNIKIKNKENPKAKEKNNPKAKEKNNPKYKKIKLPTPKPEKKKIKNEKK